jgi:hypothetical protein
LRLSETPKTKLKISSQNTKENTTHRNYVDTVKL